MDGVESVVQELKEESASALAYHQTVEKFQVLLLQLLK